MLIVLAVDGYATLLERVIGNKIGGISVKRLTYDFCIAGKHYWQVKGADDLECSEVCRSRDDEGCNGCPIANAFDRLAAIEDILGDDYDLDRLKELVQADREEKCVVLQGGSYTDKDGENALKRTMAMLNLTNNGVNRYITDAVAEKLIREEAEAALERMEEEEK